MDKDQLKSDFKLELTNLVYKHARLMQKEKCSLVEIIALQIENFTRMLAATIVVAKNANGDPEKIREIILQSIDLQVQDMEAGDNNSNIIFPDFSKS